MRKRVSIRQSASAFAIRAFIAVAVVLVLCTWTRVTQAQELAAFSDSAGETAFYIGLKAHIHQLYCDRGSMCWLPSDWLDTDLTDLSPKESNFSIGTNVCKTEQTNVSGLSRIFIVCSESGSFCCK
jgi:hypothetical protein